MSHPRETGIEQAGQTGRMTDQEWKLVGMLVTIFIFAAGSIVVALRSLRKQMETGDDRLHERINRVRDDYVRRVDLDNHMARLEGTLKEMREEQRAFARTFLEHWNRTGMEK